MKKNILLYLLIIIVTLISFLIINYLSEETLLNPIFGYFFHKAFDSIVVILSFIIFLKANKMGCEAQDKRLIVIAAGFLANSIFTLLYHALTTNISAQETLIPTVLYLDTSFLIYLIHRLLYILPIFIAPFLNSTYQGKISELKFKLYILAISIVPFLCMLNKIFTSFVSPIGISKEIIILLNYSVGLTETFLIILTIFIYADKSLYLTNKKSYFLIAGLIILGFSHVSLGFMAVTHFKSIIINLFRIFGFSLILVGVAKNEINEIKISYTYYFRQKNAVYYSIFYGFMYLIWVFTNSYLFLLKFPHIYLYITLISLIIGNLIIYKISHNISKPINNLYNNISKLTSTNTSKSINIISNDQIGTITQEVNNLFNLYLDKKQKFEREIIDKVFLIQIIDLLKISGEFLQKLQKIIIQIGIHFNMEMVLVVLANDKKIHQKPVCSFFEYLQNPSIPSIKENKNIEPFLESFIELLKYKKILIIDDVDQNIFSKNIENFYQELGIKSHISIILEYENIFLGTLILAQTSHQKNLSELNINLLKIISDGISCKLNNEKILKDIENKVYQEKQVKKIFDIIEKNPDINEVLHSTCSEITQLFNLDRVSFYRNIPEFPEESGFKAQCRASDEIPYLTQIPISVEGLQYLISFIRRNKTIVINDLEKSDLPDFIKEYFKKAETKALIALPIEQDDNFLGYIMLSQTKYPRIWKENEIALVQTIIEGFRSAMIVSQLYTDLKIKSERENSIIKIINAIGMNLELNKVLNIICEEISKLFQVDRVAMESYPKTGDYSEWSIHAEFKINPEIIGAMDINYPARTRIYIGTRMLNEGKDIILENVQESDFSDFFKSTYMQMKVKSMLIIPIKKGNDKWGIIGLFNVYDYKKWTNDEIKFLRAIAEQVYIAVKQAELYSNFKKHCDREMLIKKIIELTRSTLDIDKILEITCEELGKLFNVKRAFAIEVPDEKYRDWILRKEYKASETIKGSRDIEFDPRTAEHWGKTLLAYGTSLAIDNISESNTPDYFKKTYELLEAKSIVGVSVKKENDRWGGLFLSETDYRHWSKEDISLLEIIADQLYIAIKQAGLYLNAKKQAKQEEILREIVSKIKISQNPDEIYKYTLSKIAGIYDVNRILFIEMQPYIHETAIIKYEYIKNIDLPSLKNIDLPKTCIDMFLEMLKSKETIIIEDTKKHYAENKAAQEFFKKYFVKSMISAPFIKYDHTVDIFGSIILCSETSRIWTQDEMELLSLITESVVSIIWEITKQLEIEHLRHTFVLTLAHDFQVPIIGEHKVLEYLVSRPDDQPIGKFKEIINDIIKSNEISSDLLTKLLDSYNYESGRQILNLDKYNIVKIIDEVINSLQEFAKSKSITIDTKIQENLPYIKLDKNEIYKVLYSLLENAITYTQKQGYIMIKSSVQENSMVTCVSDNGPGILPEIRGRIFQRYAMAQAIDRKIGAGIGLYLSKMIVEAHKGRIWYNTKIKVGTTFCFSLPLKG
ncbi:MAG: GAF domain-containing protein [bacterium]